MKIFRKSTLKNGVLQKYVLLEQNKELSLVLDCRTRWSSMYKMVERFFQFLFVELEKRKPSLAKDLLCAVKKSVQQRRQHEVVNSLHYLQNPNSSIYKEQYADEIPSCSNSKEGFVTAITLFVLKK